MRFSRYLLFFLLIAISAFADQSTRTSANAPDILPSAFAGWQITSPVQTSKDPRTADSTNADVLKEYGFTDYQGATYTRNDGRKLTIKAARFADASGAYGAFTFYRSPEMLDETIGDKGCSLNQRVLFFRGNILVNAVFQQLSAMSAAELRELADDLPRALGPSRNLPTLPTYLPKANLQTNTARYIEGPIALTRVGAPLPAQYVDFQKGAEVELASYNVSGSSATLMLINYPNPQIAGDELRNIQAAQQKNQIEAQIIERRTGPILVLVSGPLSDGDARNLLSSVNYDADVTWNQNTYYSLRDNPGNLIVGVITLAGIIVGLSIVVGIAFGGFRVVIKRLFPNKVFDRPEQMEIIALHLSDRGSGPQDPV
jgi:hypothetical protein